MYQFNSSRSVKRPNGTVGSGKDTRHDRNVTIAGSLASLLLLASCGTSGGDSDSATGGGEAVSLRFAHYLPTTHTISESAFDPWMEAVESKTDEVAFEYYPAGQLVDANEIFPALKSGAIDVGFFVPANAAAAELPLADVAAVPGFPGESRSSLETAYNELLEGILYEEDFKAHNVRPLAGVIAGQYQLLSVDGPVRTEADWKGMTVRSAGGASDFLLDSLGGASVHMSAAEQFEAYQRGTVDAGINTLESITSYDFQDVISAATTNGPFGGGPAILVISDAAWEKLSPEAQEVLTSSVDEALQSLNEAYAAELDEVLGGVSSDVEFYELTDGELAALEPAIQATQDAWVAQREDEGKPGEEVLDAWAEALEKDND